jgi:hypothetical protein
VTVVTLPVTALASPRDPRTHAERGISREDPVLDDEEQFPLSPVMFA